MGRTTVYRTINDMEFVKEYKWFYLYSKKVNGQEIRECFLKLDIDKITTPAPPKVRKPYTRNYYI